MGAGGKGAGGSGAHDYFGTIAGLICAGPVDSVLGIISDGKTVWPDADGGDWETGKEFDLGTTVRSGGRAWVASSIHTSDEINRPGMTGAPWTEYSLNRSDPGVGNPVSISVPGYGIALLFWGTDDQELPEGLPPEFALNHPPYRRQCWVLFQDWLFGRERTSAPNLQVLVRRAPLQASITGDAALLDSEGQCNPLAFAAEVLGDPVFGAGNSGLIASVSWQDAADKLQERTDLWNVSPFISEATTFDAFADAVGSYVNAFKRADGTGRIELGIMPTSEAPPVFDSRFRLDTSCLCEPLEITTETGAANQVTVKYSDRVRSFKTRNAKATDTLSRGDLVGDAISLDRPWITRASQAAYAAADALRRAAEPGFSGRAVCLAERVRHIREGTVFLLQDAVTGLEIPCRCETVSEAAPPSIRRTLTFRAETGFTPILALDGSGEYTSGNPPAAETVTAFQLLQPPPALADGEKFALVALVGRTSKVTTSVRLWMQESDPTLFSDLGSQSAFAVAGTLYSDYSDEIPPSGHTQDDNSEALRISFDPLTPASDIAALGETQTADAINDARLLVFIFRAEDPSQFEIATVKSVRIESGETFYRIKTRRARYSTSRIDFTAGDRAYIIRRASLTPYTHQRFGSYSQTGQAVVLRLQASNPWRTAELADTVACPDQSFTFSDPYAPRCEWTAIEQRPNSGTAWAAVTDFTVDHPLGTQFRIVFTARDSTGDLATASIRAAGPAETTNALYLEAVAGSQDEVIAIVSLAEGDWSPFSQISDRSGRFTMTALTAIGGTSPVSLRVRNGGSTLCANPVAVPRGISISDPVTVALTCSTAGSAIEFQVVPINSGPGATWTAYSGPVTVDPDSTLYARASASGFTGSPTVRHSYRYQDPDSVG